VKEDYEAAFLQRAGDVEKLIAAKRCNAAMHFGGIAIECLLKHLILMSLPAGAMREWKTDDNDPGHTITRPGHSFDDALKRHNTLRSRVQQMPNVQKWLDVVEMPDGHYIEMRYSGKEPDEERYKYWFGSYIRLMRWLQGKGTK